MSANYINVFTGRGKLGKLEPIAETLNSVFWSPRLLSSRLTALNPKFYYYTQALARGGADAVNEICNETQARLNEIIDIEKENPSFGPFEKDPQVEPPVEPPISNLQGALNNFQMPSVSGDAFGATDPVMAASPTILPDERDREIAMRQQGIASLV